MNSPSQKTAVAERRRLRAVIAECVKLLNALRARVVA
jgi:hypothetical protein